MGDFAGAVIKALAARDIKLASPDLINECEARRARTALFAQQPIDCLTYYTDSYLLAALQAWIWPTRSVWGLSTSRMHSRPSTRARSHARSSARSGRIR